MPGTRRQTESQLANARRRSLLRSDRSPSDEKAIDKRPAGPSSHSDPGMGSPTQPLPPGTSRSFKESFLRHPKIAGGFRSELDSSESSTPIAGTTNEETLER